MENQPIVIEPIAQSPFSPQKKSNALMSVFLAFLLGAITFGFGGYYFGSRSAKSSDVTVDQNIAPEQTDTEVPPVVSAPTCEDIQGLSEHQFCTDSGKYNSDYILTSDALRIDHVYSYSLSPSKEWLFVVRYSNAFVENGGAPDENALSMVNIKTGKVIELFSQIYFPSFTEESWSPDGSAIVFTASGESNPDILGETNLYAVVYCSTSCKVLARDAGPAGMQGDPAFFVDGKIHYSDINGEAKEIEIK